jgi:hypothetical protein
MIKYVLALSSLVLYIACTGFSQVQALQLSEQRSLVVTQASSNISSNEAAAMLTLRYLSAAEATFNATVGNGRYGTLQELYGARLIDAKLRTGFSEGYRFSITVLHSSRTPSTFEATARPVTYMETGVRTLSVNELGTMLVSYVPSPQPAQMQLMTDECGSVICTEAFARTLLRLIHSAEATFQATQGNGRYATIMELADQNLIPASLAGGRLNGYVFLIRVQNGGMNEPPSFDVTATPVKYFRTGVFSYYIDETGILRGANKDGREADVSDDAYCQ